MIKNRVGGFLLFISATVFIFTSSVLPAQAVDNFLKFHWAFDEGSGTAASDTSGNNPNYPGTLYNGPTWIPGGGLTFDGVNDYARTNLALPNSMGVSDQGYTLSASVRLPDAGENGNIIHISDGANGVGWCIAMLHVDNGHFRAIGWNSGPVTALDPAVATPGQWYSIANTWSPETQRMDLYVNGSLVASSSMSNFTAADTDVYVFAGIGAGGCSNDHGFFKGDIKDVRIYSRAITQQEAQQNSDASIALPVESFSPNDDATGVSTTTTLSLTFGTSTVATSTGSISIYKTSDNSLVESISTVSSQVVKNVTAASTTFTIDPSVILNEGTGYYISIASTTFSNSTNTFYPGTAASTTWNFVTSDITPPIITNIIASSTASTSEDISWDTNELSSTNVVYSTDTSFASSTGEIDTSTRLTSHAVSLEDLLPCTLYNFKVASADAFNNYATSSANTFTTVGCVEVVETPAPSRPVLGRTGGSTSAISSLMNLNTLNNGSIHSNSISSDSTGSDGKSKISQPMCPVYTFTRQLRFGSTGEDVRNLQKLMNCLGFTVASNGPGSAGKETSYFVYNTKNAVVAFQEAYMSDVLAPIGQTKGTGIFANFSQKKAKVLMDTK